MKRLSGGAAAILLLASLASANSVAASHPDILRNYRFIPSRSTVEVTGGFAGVNQTYHARGKFGLVTGFEEGVTCAAIGCPPPPHIPFAEFVDVDAWLVPDGPLAYVLDLDDTLNLTGLDGTFQRGEPQRLFFRGKDGQGQPIRLKALLRGPLIRIVGANDPVNNSDGSVCSDCFGYTIDTLAHIRPYADFNLDGLVDRGDVDLLLTHVGAETGATFEQGDADGDGDVDGDDFMVWQRQVGTGVSLAEFNDAAFSSTAIPEPATCALLALGALAFAARLRRQRFSR